MRLRLRSIPAHAARALRAVSYHGNDTEKGTIMDYIIKTEGLHCGHCDASVETELMKVAGVTDADSDHETNTVQVHCAGEVAADALSAAVEAAGFKALAVEAA